MQIDSPKIVSESGIKNWMERAIRVYILQLVARLKLGPLISTRLQGATRQKTDIANAIFSLLSSKIKDACHIASLRPPPQ
jgi:hypothetical protein